MSSRACRSLAELALAASFLAPTARFLNRSDFSVIRLHKPRNSREATASKTDEAELSAKPYLITPTRSPLESTSQIGQSLLSRADRTASASLEARMSFFLITGPLGAANLFTR